VHTNTHTVQVHKCMFVNANMCEHAHMHVNPHIHSCVCTCSNIHRSPEKVLAQVEKNKKEKYLGPLREQRKNFTPLIYSVDGLAGKEAKSAARKVARTLSEKWGKTHSVVANFVNTKIALSLARSLSMCIRNSRNYPLRPCTWVDWTRGGGEFHLHQ